VQRRIRRIVAALAGAFLTWEVVLFLGSYVGSGCAREKVRERLAGSMNAAVTIGDLRLGLVRGAVAIDDVHIVKDDRGYLRIDVARVDVDVLPLGLAMVQGSVGDVRIRDVDVEISALGALDLRGGKRTPIRFDSLVVERAHVRIEAARLVPGLAKLDVTIDRATAGATTLRTPLSWLFAMREFSAHVDLPIGGTVILTYASGKLRLSGAMFGSDPVELPFELPVLEPARELEQLGELGQRLVRELLAQATSRWKDRATDVIRDRLP